MGSISREKPSEALKAVGSSGILEIIKPAETAAERDAFIEELEAMARVFGAAFDNMIENEKHEK